MPSPLAKNVIKTAQDAKWIISTVESCTGGMIFACLTDIAGASSALDRGFITYSNKAKQEMVGVCIETLEAHGAVSQQCAAAMAIGGITRSAADISLSVTGIAGPGGGTPDKPVGLVWMAVATKDGVQISKRFDFIGDRQAVRYQAVEASLTLILAALPKI